MENYKYILENRNLEYVETTIDQLKDFRQFAKMCKKIDIDLEYENTEMEFSFENMTSNKYNVKSKFSTKESLSEDQICDYEEQVWELTALYDQTLRYRIDQSYSRILSNK